MVSMRDVMTALFVNTEHRTSPCVYVDCGYCEKGIVADVVDSLTVDRCVIHEPVGTIGAYVGHLVTDHWDELQTVRNVYVTEMQKTEKAPE